MCSEIIQSFNKKREEGNDRILSKDFLPIKRFFALDSRAYSDGEIPVKYKEMMGLVASAVLRCNDCIQYHLQRCYDENCSDSEINEALNISLIVGGSIVIPHLRHAYEVWEALAKLPPEHSNHNANEGEEIK
jgi:AhpD family alkylhydroperoxidase